MKYKIQKLLNGKVLHFKFKNQKDICKTFIRFQEYYESPEFAGKIFTLSEYKTWYAKEYGAFTYYKEWNGFNIPVKHFKPFIDGKFDPLKKRERKIVDEVRSSKAKYVIATHRKADFEHELTHAIFNTNTKYRFSIICVLGKSKYKKNIQEISKFLAKEGYNPKVFMDEINAYITDQDKWIFDKVSIDKELAKELIELRKEF